MQEKDDRLSEAEYMEGLRELYLSGPSAGILASVGGDLHAAYRKQEIMLTIEHRMGRSFPSSRREAVWQVIEKVQKSRLRLVIKWLFSKKTRAEFASGMQGIVSLAADKLSGILTPEELEAFIGGGQPVLPLDPDKLEEPGGQK